MTGDGYRDRWVECGERGLRIRGYYFPWGTKAIPYGRIKGVRRVDMDVFSGRGRIWGTSNPRYWFHLDPRRPSKTSGLVLDVGGYVHPFITPDDPAAVEAAIRAHTARTAGGGA
ncbi:hypothetical protein POF50_009700 [Streptomyces sp. SL13]|uniref:Uncharacterized protein n=1 Tax=Streptantibioticus silvisoli TaxID=2705255 RepID=A0AA90H2R9_9ACTN|nr:hypothetical protein [Streptantibioticus silvisoli]MDI5965177.1 hypothetical protein [Streptantibioticus silvisoli]MDI5969610.1 hypothetical protein [Streptantibioticus silvisoli]